MSELEKKADKYAYEVYSTRPLGDDPTDDEIKEAYMQGYKDAMAWHYPSKGEYPPKREQVLCKLWNEDYIVAFIREDDEWTTNGKNAFANVKCWQYIVSPKEEA